MSFLEVLQKGRRSLKNTNTLVKTPGGDVFLEKRNEAGRVSLEKVASSAGYVVDLRPDLHVAAVLPGLYMGSQDVTQDENLLHQHRITHILSVGVRVYQLPEINYTFVEALDLPDFDMKPVFEQCIKLIDAVRKAGESVFVHCNAGVSRSAAIVIAYLMKCERLRYEHSLQMLRQVRSCVNPNVGFVEQLKIFEQKLFCNE